MTNEVIEGNEWAAYGALETYRQDETRDHLQGASLMMTEFPYYSVELRPPRESRKTRHRGKGNRLQFFLGSGWQVARCINPALLQFLKEYNWRAGCLKRGTSGSEEGRWKRSSNATSLAAYPTGLGTPRYLGRFPHVNMAAPSKREKVGSLEG